MTVSSDVLCISTDDDFSLARRCLRESGFSADGFVRRFGVRSTAEGLGRISRDDLGDDLLSILMRLFALEESVKKENLLRAGVTEHLCAAFERLDLVRRFPYAPGHYTATVRLRPVGDLVLACDRSLRIGATTLMEPPDTVYDPLDRSAWQYMRFLPDARCKRFLEMCAGSGVAGLHAAALFADHAWACDISQRATHFIKFNILLNAVRNISVLTGDLFDPLDGQEFDCIVAHPPYVPSLKNSTLYSAGGQIGDEILVRILRGLPQYLATDGFFYARAAVPDRKSMRFETCLREALGEKSNEFDVLLMTISDMSPLEWCHSMSREKRYSPTEAAQQMAIFESSGVESLSKCVLLLHRRAGNRRVFTARHPVVDPDRLKRLFDNELTKP